MRTIICNSLQSFWDMADNQFLEGLDVHCVFPVNDAIRDFILAYQQQYSKRPMNTRALFYVWEKFQGRSESISG
ncbi:hypothetical protein, partial [Vibrio sp. 1401]|uniref:hypothetical protein n=1 Tax=Vibrio sp. 1401 TaxID=3074553 RepID=UPI002965C945|nr:hypothetical protein [Vibrio sp. 1401]